MKTHERGQILALFAVVVTGVLAMMALAIDVSSAYSARQAYRTASDAAALSGAQDLQGTTRAVTATSQQQAEADAMASLVKQFNASSTPTGAGCDPALPIVNCSLPGTPFVVGIRTPVLSCVSCDKAHSVQVTVANPNFPVSFARLLGVTQWNVATSSVAGLTFNASYALMTLRPPASGSVSDVKDIAVNGNTHVAIHTGDVGSNANMNYDGTCGPGGSVLTLDAGYSMYYYDPFNPQEWCTNNPPGNKITTLIQDPKYQIPAVTASTPSRSGAVGPSNPACAAAITAAKVADPYKSMANAAGSSIECLLKGRYTSDPYQGGGSPPALVILQPGLYFFEGGLTVKSTLIGGYTPSSEGVALVFNEDTNQFHANSGTSVYLNAGGRIATPVGAAATAALDFGAIPAAVQTNGVPAIPMTILVKPDLNCEGPGRAIVLPIPSACAMPEGKRSAIQITGSANLYLGGVQYGPTDNMSLNASSSVGYVGQIVAWTVTYSGGTTINQEGLTQSAGGVLRLDAACTAPGTPCVP